MLTILRNPYQTVLQTPISQIKYEGDTSHLILEDTVCFDYDAYGVPKEHATISGRTLLRTYTAGDELVHVVDGKADEKTAEIELPYGERLMNLREFTLRYIFRHVLARLFNRTPYNFDSRGDFSRFLISGCYTDMDIAYLTAVLDRSAERLIRAGLDLRTVIRDGSPETSMYGMSAAPWPGPHLKNTAEVYRYDLEAPVLGERYAEIRYHLF